MLYFTYWPILQLEGAHDATHSRASCGKAVLAGQPQLEHCKDDNQEGHIHQAGRPGVGDQRGRGHNVGGVAGVVVQAYHVALLQGVLSTHVKVGHHELLVIHGVHGVDSAAHQVLVDGVAAGLGHSALGHTLVLGVLVPDCPGPPQHDNGHNEGDDEHQIGIEPTEFNRVCIDFVHLCSRKPRRICQTGNNLLILDL